MMANSWQKLAKVSHVENLKGEGYPKSFQDRLIDVRLVLIKEPLCNHCCDRRRTMSLIVETKRYSPPRVDIDDPVPAEVARSTSTTHNLADKLWIESAELIEKAKETIFIKGIYNGNLDPNFYGSYMVQDAIYCAKTGELWKIISEDDRSTEELKTFASKAQLSFLRCAKGFLSEWHIQQVDGILLGPAAARYIWFLQYIMINDPGYLLIATYACARLWPYLAKYCLNNLPNVGHNNYEAWINENKREGNTLRRQTDAINSNAANFDEAKCKELFQFAVQCEIDFFNQSLWPCRI